MPNVLWQTCSGVLLGLGRIRPWNYVQLASPLLTVIFTLVLVVALGGDVRAALVRGRSRTSVTAASCTRAHARPLEPVPPRVARRLAVSRSLVRLALAMGALQVISLIGYRAELFVLEAIDGVSAVGIYSIANQAAESMWLIAAAIATAITAPVVRAERGGRGRARQALAREEPALHAGAGAVVAVDGAVRHPVRAGRGVQRCATRRCSLLLPGAVAYAPVQILVVYLSVRRGRPRLSLAAGVVAMVVTVAAPCR